MQLLISSFLNSQIGSGPGLSPSRYGHPLPCRDEDAKCGWNGRSHVHDAGARQCER